MSTSESSLCAIFDMEETYKFGRNMSMLDGDDIIEIAYRNFPNINIMINSTISGINDLSNIDKVKMRELLLERANKGSVRSYINIGLRNDYSPTIDVNHIIRITECPKEEKNQSTFGCALYTWRDLAFFIASVEIDDTDIDSDDESDVEDLLMLHRMKLTRTSSQTY